MEDRKITEEEFKKQRDEAIKKIVEILNTYDLTIVTEHNIKIVPRQQLTKE